MRKWIRYVGATVLAGGLLCAGFGGCECRQDIAAPGDANIENQSLTVQYPNAPVPSVVFPEALRTPNQELNAFIHRTLQVCSKGDYDQFRQLFGTRFNPPGPRDFERIWHSVAAIDVQGVHTFPEEGKPAAEYFVHVKVHRREPDKKDRTVREVVVVIFREAGQWRLGDPPQEVVRKILGPKAQLRPRPHNKGRGCDGQQFVCV